MAVNINQEIQSQKKLSIGVNKMSLLFVSDQTFVSQFDCHIVMTKTNKTEISFANCSFVIRKSIQSKNFNWGQNI